MASLPCIGQVQTIYRGTQSPSQASLDINLSVKPSQTELVSLLWVSRVVSRSATTVASILDITSVTSISCKRL